MENKKLYRSATDRMFTGVCGGLAEYFAVDSSLLRLIWVLVVVFTGFVPGVLVYVVAIFVMPEKPTPAVSETPSAS
ncbi:MAG: PspC domain-containing protein [Patescibacteria group bacterium]